MAAMNALSTLCVGLALMASLTPQVEGHGYMSKPAARQLCIRDERGHALVQEHSCHGARGMVKLKGGYPGPCGDPCSGGDKPSNFKDTPCEPQEEYTQGQVIDVELTLIFNHGGHFEFFLCDQRNGDQACFDRHPLKTLPHNIEMWHILEPIGSNAGNDNPDYYTVQVQLPDDVACPEGCVLSWAWWTSHNCVYPCDEQFCEWYAQGKTYVPKPDMDWSADTCATKRPAVGQDPQIIVNCADVRIMPNGNAAVTTPETADSPKTEPDTDASVSADTTSPTNSDTSEYEAEDDGYGDLMQRSASSLPSLGVQSNSADDADDEDTDCTCMSGRRRMLMADKVRESDSREDISAAGGDMTCGDFVVADVLDSLSTRRKHAGASELICSNRATGTAENHSHTMCQLGRVLHDANDLCKNSHFAASRCTTIIFQTSSTETEDVITALGDNLEYLTSWEVMEMGVGYKECGDAVYWTIIIA